MAHEQPGLRRNPRNWLFALGASVALSLLALTLFSMSIGSGVTAGPALQLRLGEYYLVAQTTEHPACLPLPQQCFIPRPTFAVPQPRYYAIWIGQISYHRSTKTTNNFAQTKGRNVVELRLAPP